MQMQIEVVRLEKIKAAARYYIFDFSEFAEIVAGDSLVTPSVPTTSALAAAGLTVGSPTLTTEIVSEGGRTIAIGEAVTALISGGTVGKVYTVDCLCTTDNSATLVKRLELLIK